MSSLKLFLVPLLMLSMGSPVWAQNGVSQASTPATGAVGTHTAQDVRFVTAASAAGDTEIMAARLAQTQGQSAKVKSFAATMIADHGKANDQLKTMRKKTAIPSRCHPRRISRTTSPSCARCMARISIPHIRR